MNAAVQPQAEAAEALWKLALEAVGDSVWDWHIQAGVEIYSPSLMRLFGYAPGEIEPSPDALDALTHADDREQMALDREAHFCGEKPVYRNEHRVQCKDGTWKWVLTRGLVIARDAEGRPLRMVGTHTDISERKAGEDTLWRQANFDPLTGLANRRQFAERFALELRRARRDTQPGSSLALLALDLDHFKAVNDDFGHAAGDELLAQVAKRLRAQVREIDLVARLGGDEFALLLPDFGADLQALERVAASIVKRLAQPFDLSQAKVQIGVSIGIALAPGDATEAKELQRCADQALYAVKAQGKGAYRFFTAQLQRAADARSQLAQALKQGLERSEFLLRYQPIVATTSGECVQAEVLLRWRHPQLGELPPRSFLATAESSGLMEELGDWVLREAARQLKIWRAAITPNMTLSVNLAGSQLRQWAHSVPDWAAKLLQLGVPGSGLMLDVREEQLRDSQLSVLLQLPALQAAGIKVALDDFGSDVCSLEALSHRGLSAVKLSRERVLAANEALGREWLLCVTHLAQAQKLCVVAKGVEMMRLRPLLSELGVDALMGDALSPPLTAAEFEAWVPKRNP